MIKVDAFIRSFRVTWTAVKETDAVRYCVHACKGTELVAGNFTPSSSNLIYEGPSNTYIHILPEDEYGGMYYIKLAAVDTFGTDELNYSDMVSVFVPDLQIMPDELFTSLRTDFYIRDTTFLFGDVDTEGIRTNATTLKWDAGWIDRADKVYVLQAGALVDATDAYLIATLVEPVAPETVGTATLSKTAFSAGLPTLRADQIIVAVTSGTTNAVGNYMAYVRQGNSMMFEGAYIRDATIGDAKIFGTLSANRITTLKGGVEIVENGITLTTVGALNTDTSDSKQAIEDMSADDKVTPVEKLNLKKEYTAIVSEYSIVTNQAATYGISTATFTTAYNTMNSTLSPLLVDVTTTSTIAGSTVRAALSGYYSAKASVQKSITDAADAANDAAISAANSATSAANTAQSTANSAYGTALAAASTAVWGNLSSTPTGYHILNDLPGSGLKLTSSYLGYYGGSGVGAYMDSSGYFYLKGATGNQSLTWNGSTLTIRGNLTADNGYIGNLNVDTLQIAGEAVTVPVSVSTTAAVDGSGMWAYTTILNVNIYMAQPGKIFCSAALNQDYSAQQYWHAFLAINNTQVFQVGCVAAGRVSEKSIALAGGLSVPAGLIPVGIQWFGESSAIQVRSGALFATGVKR